MIAELELLADDLRDVRPAAGGVHIVAVGPVVAAAALVNVRLLGTIPPERPLGEERVGRGKRTRLEAAAHDLWLHVHEHSTWPKFGAWAVLVNWEEGLEDAFGRLRREGIRVANVGRSRGVQKKRISVERIEELRAHLIAALA